MSARMEPPHTVGGAISRRARRTPDKPALIGIDEPGVSFAELAAAIGSVREQLAGAALRRNDRVGVVVAPGIAGARLLVSLACNIAAVPIDPTLSASEVAKIIDAMGVKALARPAPDGALRLEILRPANEDAAAMRPTTSTDVALVLRAADDLERKKPMQVRHRDLRIMAGMMSLQDGLDVGGNDRAVCLLPLHRAGVEALFVPLILGASIGFAPAGRQFDLAAMDVLQPTFLCATPEALQAVLERLRALPPAAMTCSLRFVLCAPPGLPQHERLAAESLLRAPVHELAVARLQVEGGNNPARTPASQARAGDLPGLAPADDLLELEVRDIWKRLLGHDDVGLDEHFFDAGGDSLLATQMLLELETLAGRPYPESELSVLTIRHIAQVLKDRMPEERGCMSQAKAGSGIPLFFCHGDFQARGLYAHQLAALLPQDQPVYVLHPERVPAPGTTAEELAHRYLDEVLHVASGSPVMLGGYCNGGYPAWHLAHLLRARGVEVVALLLVETPSFNARPIARKIAGLLRAVAAVLPGRAARLVREDAMRAVWSLYRHGRGKLAVRLYQAVRERTRTPAAPGAVPSWWIFVRSMATRYVPPAIDVDVYCVLAGDGTRLDTEPACWRALASSVTEISVPGTHLSAVISQRRTLASAFARAISEAAARRSATVARAMPRRALYRAAPAAPAG